MVNVTITSVDRKAGELGKLHEHVRGGLLDGVETCLAGFWWRREVHDDTLPNMPSVK